MGEVGRVDLEWHGGSDLGAVVGSMVIYFRFSSGKVRPPLHIPTLTQSEKNHHTGRILFSFLKLGLVIVYGSSFGFDIRFGQPLGNFTCCRLLCKDRFL